MKPTQLNKNLKQNNHSDFIIRINPDKEVPLTGEIEHVQSRQKKRFADYLEMIMLIQKKLDEMGVPEPETRFRSW